MLLWPLFVVVGRCVQRTSQCHFIDRLSDKKVSSRFAELSWAVLPGQGVTVNIRQTFRQYAQYRRLLSLYHAQRFGDNLNFLFCFFSYLMKVFMYNVSLFQLKKNIMLFDKFRAMKIVANFLLLYPSMNYIGKGL